MNLKSFIQSQKIRQVEIAKSMNLDGSRLSRFLNGWEPLPPKYLEPLCHSLQLSKEQLSKLNVRIKEHGIFSC